MAWCFWLDVIACACCTLRKNNLHFKRLRFHIKAYSFTRKPNSPHKKQTHVIKFEIVRLKKTRQSRTTKTRNKTFYLTRNFSIYHSHSQYSQYLFMLFITARNCRNAQLKSIYCSGALSDGCGYDGGMTQLDGVVGWQRGSTSKTILSVFKR